MWLIGFDRVSVWHKSKDCPVIVGDLFIKVRRAYEPSDGTAVNAVCYHC